MKDVGLQIQQRPSGRCLVPTVVTGLGVSACTGTRLRWENRCVVISVGITSVDFHPCNVKSREGPCSLKTLGQGIQRSNGFPSVR